MNRVEAARLGPIREALTYRWEFGLESGGVPGAVLNRSVT